MPRKPLALAVAIAAFALQASSAQADPALAGTFDVTGNPGRMATGPDGNVWFTLSTTDDKQLGKITPSGAVTEFHLPVTLTGLTTGPDGNLWGTTTNAIVKIPPANPTAATSFTDNNIASGSDITTGPNGNLWTGGNPGLVVEIPPGNPGQAGGDTAHSSIVQGTGLGITSGPDGNLWIIDNNVTPDDSAIVRFNTAGLVQGTPAKPGGGLNNAQIAAGPAGQAVFTQPVNTPERVGRVDLSGNIQFTAGANGLGDPTGIVFGNDGAYWIANFGANALRRLTPTGDLTQPINFDAGPRYLAKGANDTLWVGLEQANKIAEVTGVSAPPPVIVPPMVTPPTNKPSGPAIVGHIFRVSGRFVTIPVGCAGSNTCSGRITLRTAKVVAAKKRKLKLGSARFSIVAGQTKRVKVKLSKKAGKLVRKEHALQAVATIGHTSKKVTLKRKK